MTTASRLRNPRSAFGIFCLPFAQAESKKKAKKTKDMKKARAPPMKKARASPMKAKAKKPKAMKANAQHTMNAHFV